MYQSNRIKCAPSSTWCACKACLEKLARLDLWSSLGTQFKAQNRFCLRWLPHFDHNIIFQFYSLLVVKLSSKLFVYHMISNLIEQIMIKITNKGKCPSYLFIAFVRSWRELWRGGRRGFVTFSASAPLTASNASKSTLTKEHVSGWALYENCVKLTTWHCC